MKRGGGAAISFLMTAIAILLPFTFPIAPAQAQTVAMITDLSGKVEARDDKPRILSILAEIKSGVRLRLQSGARLVALYLKSGDEYSFTGPSQVEFQDSAPRVLSGAMPQKRASPLGRKVAVKPGGVRQAAFVMRSGRTSGSIKLLNLSGTKTLETYPEFRWQRIEGAGTYRLELTDGSGNVLVERDMDETSYRLPGSVPLRAGAMYTWEVSTRLPDGRRYVSAGDFTLAPAVLRREAEDLRPPSDAPLSDRVAFAAWLEQHDLRDEARGHWRALAQDRPADTRLKALAAD